MKNYFKTLWEDPAAARKFYVTLLGVLLMIGTSALTPDLSAAQWVVAVLTALSVYVVPNRDTDALQRDQSTRAFLEALRERTDESHDGT